MKSEMLLMAYRDEASDAEHGHGDERPLDGSLPGIDSGTFELDADADDHDDPHPEPDRMPLEPIALLEHGRDLYAPTMRSMPLLSRDEEHELGRAIQDSRLRMTEALGRVPAALGIFVAFLEQADARERPITDALFAPFSSFSALSEENDEGDNKNWRHAAHTARRHLAAWRRVADGADREDLEPMRARLRALVCALQPGWPALREALSICEALDERVAAVETADGAFHADALPDGRDSPAHAALLRIEDEAGVDITTLRESRRAAASAYARYTSARDRMVNANLRLAYLMAFRLRGNGLSIDDLVQEAMIGLMRAVDKFDYRLGYKFSTYAVQWIRQTTTRAIADSSRTIRVATNVHDNIVRLRRLARQREQQLGRQPNADELAATSGMPVSKITQYLALARQSVSLDAPPADSEDSPLSSVVPDRLLEDPREQTHESRLSASVAAILDTLPSREALILRLRHGIGGSEARTLEEIGSMLGITRERTRQLESRAFKRLRETVKRDLLRGLDD
jgi:RNA polymerase primary sigma factor